MASERLRLLAAPLPRRDQRYLRSTTASQSVHAAEAGTIAWRRVGRRTVLVLGLNLLILAVALAIFRLRYAGRVYPGVFVEGVALGGLERSSAVAALDERAARLERGFVTFTYGGQTWQPSMTELGVGVDVAGSLAAALDVGRNDDAWGRIVETRGLLDADTRLPLRFRLDDPTLSSWFDRVDRELGLPPRDAVLIIEGAAVSIQAETDGTTVDRVSARALIVSALDSLTPLNHTLPVTPFPVAVRASDLEPARAEVERALTDPVTVTFEQEMWPLAPDDLGRFIEARVDRTPDGEVAATAELDLDRLTQWLETEFADEINREPVDASVGWDEELVPLMPSSDGIALEPEAFAQAVSESVFGDHTPVEIPVTVTKPAVDSTNLAALGITTELGTGSSNYEGSKPDRATNIQVGADLLSGTLIPPGGEFSFNYGVGVINEEAGFVEANVIAGERIGRDIGGGICQVSTTVYRAALLAGLPITEWWPHLYRLSFYERDGWEAGYDASILQPEGDPFSGGDFQFANPTDSWMLVESWANGTNVWVTIYGPDLGYTVTLEEPTVGEPISPTENLEIVDPELPAGTVQQTELEQPGLDVTFDRIVTDRDGREVSRDTFDTHYQPQANVWKVSPDMEGASPASEAH